MPEEVKEEKKKGPIGKLKDKIEDADEQLAVLSTSKTWYFGLVWWYSHIELCDIPGLPQQKIDPTFIANVFTGVLATFGVQTAKKSGDGTMKMNGAAAGAVTKADMEKLIEKATQAAPAQVIRIEQAPLSITTAPSKSDDTYKM